jgi:hypothetical protein
LSQYRAPLSQTKCAKNSGHFPRVESGADTTGLHLAGVARGFNQNRKMNGGKGNDDSG